MDKSGFFDQVKHKVAGEEMTLNALEIKKLLRSFKDPRIHFALACAAKSCPPLASHAYRPKELDLQLGVRTKLALNDAKFIRVDQQGHSVIISKIFHWYHQDFTQDGNSILEFINQYRSTPIPSNFQINFYEYNWQLNDQG